MVDKFLGKKYKLASSENFEEFMKALGIGMVVRKLGNAASPVIDLTKVGDEYTLTSISTFKNVALKFKDGVEFDQDTPDGRKVKSIIKINGCTLHELQKDTTKDQKSTIDRTFSNDEVKMVMEVEGVSATRIYKVLG